MGAFDTHAKAKQVDRLIKDIERSGKHARFGLAFAAVVSLATLAIAYLTYVKTQ